MVRLYEKYDSTPSILCELDPTVCNVTEEAGGSYELYMEHPEDQSGKYKLLQELRIIEAPVPPMDVPAITMPATSIMTVTAAADFWKSLPTYKKSGSTQDKTLARIRENPLLYIWSSTKGYNYGDYVIYNGNTIYMANTATYGAWDSSKWNYIEPLTPGSSTPTSDYTYVAGVKYSPGLSVGAVVTKIADFNSSYYQIRDNDGRVGYFEKDKVTITSTASETIPAQQIRTQLFRIYQVQGDDDTHIIRVNARHISYDFQGNRILECTFTEAEPASAIAILQGRLMIPDDRVIACDMESDEYTSFKITRDWSFKNPINALLDEDTGLVPFLKAKLIRNNRNFYILDNRGRITAYDYQIEYGVNLTGIAWTRNDEQAITRVIPRCNNTGSDYLYLEHGGTWSDEEMETWVSNNEIYVDSPIADFFPYARIEILDCDYSVGEKYIPPNSTEETTRTEASCREEMLNDAKRRFTDEHCDGIDVTLTVNFLILGDTEEYRQYKGLQRVNIYDYLSIKSKQFTILAQITQYEYDSLKGRYNYMTIGKVNAFHRRVTGSRVVNETITYNKLAPGLIQKFRTPSAT